MRDEGGVCSGVAADGLQRRGVRRRRRRRRAWAPGERGRTSAGIGSRGAVTWRAASEKREVTSLGHRPLQCISYETTALPPLSELLSILHEDTKNEEAKLTIDGGTTFAPSRPPLIQTPPLSITGDRLYLELIPSPKIFA